jgi:nucleoside-diphosphate-sugar epimerase
MKVLITGGGGFVGSHLVDSQLAQGHSVRTIDLNTDRLAHVAGHDRLEILNHSLTDFDLLPQLLSGVNVVYHLASAHLDVTLSADDYRQVNVEATAQLLNAAHDAGVKRFVHCSTNSVIGEIKNPPVDETAACRPTNIYEQTKLKGEQAALAFFRDTGFPIVVIRPAWVYGPRCPRTARLMRTVKKGRFIMFGNGKTLRHPIYITDAIRGLELAASAPEAAGEIYFIAGAKAVTIAELVQTIAAVQGVRPPRLRLPLVAGQAVAYTLQLAFKPIRRSPPISPRTLDFYTKNNAYDITKARHDLGFQPLVDLPAGLKLTLAEASAS